MGMTYTSIPFFDQDITIDVTMATHEDNLKEMTIGEFANGRRVSVMRSDEDGTIYVQYMYSGHDDYDFISGRECD